MSIILVTGTNTDVGKTITTAVVAAKIAATGRSVAVMKPIQTGEPEGRGDTTTITQLIGDIPAYEVARYPEPLAPNLSARRAGITPVDMETVAQEIEKIAPLYDVVLVEGAGGLLVRLGENWTLADLAARLKAPLLLVTSTGLGSLNLAELSVEACTRRGLTVRGIIGGSLPVHPDLATRLNLEEFPEVTGVPYLGSVPEGLGELIAHAGSDSAPLLKVIDQIAIDLDPLIG